MYTSITAAVVASASLKILHGHIILTKYLAPVVISHMNYIIELDQECLNTPWVLVSVWSSHESALW